MTQNTSQMLTESYIRSAIDHPEVKLFCQNLHKGISCQHKFIDQFLSGCKSVSKMYMIVHLVPFLLFKRKKLKEKPKKQLSKLIIAFLKSMLFAGGYSALVRYGICLWTRLRTYESNCGVFVAIFAGITLVFQPKGRQSQIALFCLNKSMETLYNAALRRGYPVRIPKGQCLLVGISLGFLCYHYFNNQDSIRQNYRKIIDRLLKDS